MNEYVLKKDILKYLEKKSSIEISTNSVLGKDISRAIDVLYCDIENMPVADVQPIVYAHKTINVGKRSYCSNCGKLAIMEDFCSKCRAKVKDDGVE